MNNKGMTLIEVMMAVAIFGIIIVVFSSAMGSFIKIDRQEVNRLQMMEVAREVTEIIKGNPDSFDLAQGTNEHIVEHIAEQYPYYEIKYSFYIPNGVKNENPSGKMLTVIVSPLGEDPEESTRSCTLVSWLPDSGIRPNVPQTESLPTADIDSSDWKVSDDGTVRDNNNDWKFEPVDSPDEVYKRIKGHGGPYALLYGYGIHKFTSFDYTIKLNYVQATGQGENDRAGIIFTNDTGDGNNNIIEYKYIMSNVKTTGVDHLQLRFEEKNGGQLISTVVYEQTPGINTNTEYYLRAIVNAGDVVLEFGYYQGDNQIKQLSNYKLESRIPTSDEDPIKYTIGIIDEGAGNYQVRFSFPSTQGDSGCDI